MTQRFRPLLAVLAFAASQAGAASKVWVSDQGDGTYRNPVLYADYSDPDAVRVGRDFYMTASSFNASPGLPILHSRDLVNWELIAHAYGAQPPYDLFDKPRHGAGSWAPAIRHHDGEFFIFYPDPDFGIYMVKARDPRGPWSEPKLIKAAKGWIDPAPLWEDKMGGEEGRAYLVTALARSRAGIKSTLIVSRMSPDGTRLLDDGVIVYDGHEADETIEGPKPYKRNGWYYIFAPAGGVPTGWQLVLRSKSVFGPYERKVVLEQKNTPTNGPHQGAWVDTPTGENWFLHFQDKGAYGRILHLQPMHWVDDWPVMGDAGAPVLKHLKPDVGANYPIATPPDSDDFASPSLGLQWQWQANPQPGWGFPSAALGVMRLYAVPPPDGYVNFWQAPNLLLQKFPAPAFMVTTRMTLTARGAEDRAGLVVMGTDYAWIGLRKRGDMLQLVQMGCLGADRGGAETEWGSAAVKPGQVFLRARIGDGAKVRFSYSADGKAFTELGRELQAQPGRWIGAKIGLFAMGAPGTLAPASAEWGNADFDDFLVERTALAE
jgi:beta-xylosidase